MLLFALKVRMSAPPLALAEAVPANVMDDADALYASAVVVPSSPITPATNENEPTVPSLPCDWREPSSSLAEDFASNNAYHGSIAQNNIAIAGATDVPPLGPPPPYSPVEVVANAGIPPQAGSSPAPNTDSSIDHSSGQPSAPPDLTRTTTAPNEDAVSRYPGTAPTVVTTTIDTPAAATLGGDEPVPIYEPDDARSKWSCQVCTLINSVNTTTCAACGAPTDNGDVLQHALQSGSESTGIAQAGVVPAVDAVDGNFRSTYDDVPLSDEELAQREERLLPYVDAISYYIRGDGPGRGNGGELPRQRGCFLAGKCISWMIEEKEDQGLRNIKTRQQGLQVLQDMVYADIIHTVGRRKDPPATSTIRSHGQVNDTNTDAGKVKDVDPAEDIVFVLDDVTDRTVLDRDDSYGVLRFGRRFKRMSKGDSIRAFKNSKMLQSIQKNLDAAAVKDASSAATAENTSILGSKEENTGVVGVTQAGSNSRDSPSSNASQRSRSISGVSSERSISSSSRRGSTIGKSLPNIFTRVSRRIGFAPTQKSMAAHIREAIKIAILCESAHRNNSIADSATSRGAYAHLRAHDYGAIDRSMRCPYVEEKTDGMQPGLRSSYAPGVFRFLRSHFGVSEDDFCASVIDHPLVLRDGVNVDAATQSQNSDTTSLSSGGGGRSGAVFFFSADRHFVVKSVTKSEAKLARRNLSSYTNHVTSYPDSLLPRVFLLIKVAVGTRSQDVIRVMVTNNVFNVPRGLRLGLQFDLKGSTANRWISAKDQIAYAREHSKASNAKNFPLELPTLKDLNWKSPLELPKRDRMALHKQLSIDSSWLKKCHIMDYSLLIGFGDAVSESGLCTSDGQPYHPAHHRTSPTDLSHLSDSNRIGRRTQFQRFFGGLRAQRENKATGFTTGLDRVYYIALIDVLQTYDSSKKTERILKVNILKPLQSLFWASGAGGAEMEAKRKREKEAKKNAKRGWVPRQGFKGLHIAVCPYCGQEIPVSDSYHNHMVATGVYGPVMCTNARGRRSSKSTGIPSGRPCEGALYGFDWVPPEILTEDRNISSIEPLKYCQRFMQFIDNRLLANLDENKNGTPSRFLQQTMGSRGFQTPRVSQAPQAPQAPQVPRPTPQQRMVQPATQLAEVTVPYGVRPGSYFVVRMQGRNYQVQCPINQGPGSRMRFRIPG